MWIKQEPNSLELWNKLHFEEKKKRAVYTMFKKIQYLYLLNKYTKCNIYRLEVRYDHYSGR